MNELKTFNHQMFGELPLIIVDGKEYFGATDVAKSLEYKQPEHAVKNHCDSEGCISYTVPTDGGKQQKNFITLGNVSRLIVAASKQSKNPEIQQKAKVYEKWIFDEVIPSVHKQGGYIATTDDDDDETIMAKALILAQKTIKKKQYEILEQQRIIEVQRPKVVYADAVEVSEDTVLVKDLATVLRQKGVNIGEVRLFKWLRENGYLCKQKGEMWNMPTQRSLELGVIVVKHGLRTGSNGEMKKTRTPKITGKGQVYFINKILEEQGLLAM
ncbi:phage antirepressor KilAC domain-containing protein [Lysinibacillus fusiformis]|uniref:phage antirepressor n=1 Tax=Lysinibacillus fusiformis TaxID=28031 RepID=UPI00030AE842|nr:phage antirepressor KilAC domain-containing protein [Lysinibacillus fusiformis]MED4078826.1 phage antirepressor KilAC domain-containing protein [Lysinibacillus fusiformis]